MEYVKCPNCGKQTTAISFVSKSTAQAEIKALKAFDGFAKIELVYVEKYVDGKGFTRANTYTKDLLYWGDWRRRQCSLRKLCILWMHNK